MNIYFFTFFDGSFISLFDLDKLELGAAVVMIMEAPGVD